MNVLVSLMLKMSKNIYVNMNFFIYKYQINVTFNFYTVELTCSFDDILNKLNYKYRNSFGGFYLELSMFSFCNHLMKLPLSKEMYSHNS